LTELLDGQRGHGQKTGNEKTRGLGCARRKKYLLLHGVEQVTAGTRKTKDQRGERRDEEESERRGSQ
jgi:hypothetical protein